MRNILVATVVCLGVTYALDAYFLNGYYYSGLAGMFAQMKQNWRLR